MKAILIVALVALAAIFLIPGMSNSLMTLVSGETVYCQEAPYNPNCQCTIDRERVFSNFMYSCITHSPKSTVDCDWCQGQCLEWQKVWEIYNTPESYNEYCQMDTGGRNAPSGYACVAKEVNGGGHLECVSIPYTYPQGLITFCSDDAIREIVTEWTGTDEELVSFFENGCPNGALNPEDQCVLSFSGGSRGGVHQSGADISFSECLSNCYEEDGTLRGGHVVWEAYWFSDTREIQIADGGSYFENCIEGL